MTKKHIPVDEANQDYLAQAEIRRAGKLDPVEKHRSRRGEETGQQLFGTNRSLTGTDRNAWNDVDDADMLDDPDHPSRDSE